MKDVSSPFYIPPHLSRRLLGPALTRWVSTGGPATIMRYRFFLGSSFPFFFLYYNILECAPPPYSFYSLVSKLPRGCRRQCLPSGSSQWQMSIPSSLIVRWKREGRERESVESVGDCQSLFFRRCVYNAICISPLDTLAAAPASFCWGVKERSTYNSKALSLSRGLRL